MHPTFSRRQLLAGGVALTATAAGTGSATGSASAADPPPARHTVAPPPDNQVRPMTAVDVIRPRPAPQGAVLPKPTQW